MFVVGALLAVTSVSAEPEYNDENAFFDPSEKSQYLFNAIMNNSWEEGSLVYPTMLRVGWPLWTAGEKRQVVTRMQEQGLISPEQAQFKNWINLPRGPEITIGG